GHGFEIVQSLYPGWRFRAADTVAAVAMHGALVCGPMARIDHPEKWLGPLAGFSITLARDGAPVDQGVAENVLGGPLQALRHFVAGLEGRPMARSIEPGDLVTTGTITRAFPCRTAEPGTPEAPRLP